MDSLSIPPTIYVAFGVITAALLAGFFSFLNLVSAKENKVSEFRLAWVDGLRDEVAIYTAAVQELVRVDGPKLYDLKDSSETKTIAELRRERHLETRDAYNKVAESLSRIQLRLNPKHVNDNPDGDEARLMASIQKTRDLFNGGYYKEASKFCDDIREVTAPLLKKTWDQVKKGELGYRLIRASALIIIIAGTTVTFGFGYSLLQHSIEKNKLNLSEHGATNESSTHENLTKNSIKTEKTNVIANTSADSQKSHLQSTNERLQKTQAPINNISPKPID
ncbi:hypothetical protein HU718_016475 [Pseudomonas tensinigenes]|uniref:Chemotaxis methyl-accepting receptor HlyB-like 4HB MCP domain-containing protein n=1 Tax=Pseudomonas tensinigenes TaxID=2745511 RepID=A0ABX8PQY3_9PSED|nr:hypothetical protein [Pseudomonas tensinigenes]QXI03634.1 hypothetical protein HU718_016475 [Pseudomonas tensinigenes]